MKKIRINELARELEVKPGVILDMLPVLGVQEKKTHSSSIDEDVALELRRRLIAEGSVRTAEERSNGKAYEIDYCFPCTTRSGHLGNGWPGHGQQAVHLESAQRSDW